MVTMRSVGLTALTGIAQERTTSPLMCTEHAPHCATPQPYLVPVSPTCSRMTHSSGVSASTCDVAHLAVDVELRHATASGRNACDGAGRFVLNRFYGMPVVTYSAAWRGQAAPRRAKSAQTPAAVKSEPPARLKPRRARGVARNLRARDANTA